jgi:hypothetical protein
MKHRSFVACFFTQTFAFDSQCPLAKTTNEDRSSFIENRVTKNELPFTEKFFTFGSKKI